jgi:hypothetical protein
VKSEKTTKTFFDLDSLIAPEPNSPELENSPSLLPPPVEKPISDRSQIPEPSRSMPKIFKILFDNPGESEVDLLQPPATNSRLVSRKGASPPFPHSFSKAEVSDSFQLPEKEEKPNPLPDSPSPSPPDNQYEYREVVVDRNGLPRQAGSDTPEGLWIKAMRERAEKSLFVFLKAILGRFFLTDHFHRDICNFLQVCPPFRKLVLMPREHAKTTIVAGGLPAHILIQPAESNIYFPGLEGSECRLLLCGETETMAKKNLRVVKSIFEENKVFRAFWPERCWEKGGRQAREWSTQAIIIPRRNEWPDPTIRAVGVGGAITGSRPNVMIKDDLVSFKAANSEVVMAEAIEWHKASRALLDKYEVESGLQSLEFLIGCLTGDSKVLTDRGEKYLTDMKVGDTVLSPDIDGSVWYRKVEAVIPQGKAKVLEVKTKDHLIRATHNHPFLVKTFRKAPSDPFTWIKAEDLKEKDFIRCYNYIDKEFNLTYVVSIRELPDEEDVWDLTVEGTPSFFANGLAVHNTRWAVYDLYSEIIDNDPSVEVNDERYHRIIKDGKILWHEKYTQADIDQLMAEHGSMFYLLYLNSAADPSLTDFDINQIRKFTIKEGNFLFAGDARDTFLRQRMETLCGTGEAQVQIPKPGTPLRELRLNEMIKARIGVRLRG